MADSEKRKVCFIPLSQIKIDRMPINPYTLSLIDYIRDGGKVKPIKVVINPKGGYIIRDGRHRFIAHKMLGIEKIEAKFSTIAPYKI